MKKRCYLFILMVLGSSSSIAGPWFTGPLLAPAGKTIPRGHVNFELYGFDVKDIGIFNRHWRLVHTPSSRSKQVSPLLTYGLADRVDIQVGLPYVVNHSHGKRGHHIGDGTILMGFQAMKQKEYKWRPNLRITIQELFPTGRYEQLTPTDQGTGGTGAGSYETTMALNFQHLYQFTDVNYLRSRLVISYQVPSQVPVRGLNAYGGNITTKGIVYPGNQFGFDLAGEFTITQHWVAVMEGYYVQRNETTFTGFRGIPINGKVPQIGHPFSEEISLAPAVEFNFNEHIGIIGGLWFAVKGKSATDFQSAVIAINIYY